MKKTKKPYLPVALVLCLPLLTNGCGIPAVMFASGTGYVLLDNYRAKGLDNALAHKQTFQCDVPTAEKAVIETAREIQITLKKKVIKKDGCLIRASTPQYKNISFQITKRTEALTEVLVKVRDDMILNRPITQNDMNFGLESAIMSRLSQKLNLGPTTTSAQIVSQAEVTTDIIVGRPVNGSRSQLLTAEMVQIHQ